MSDHDRTDHDKHPDQRRKKGFDPVEGDPDLTVAQPTDDVERDEGAGKDDPTPNPAEIAP